MRTLNTRDEIDADKNKNIVKLMQDQQNLYLTSTSIDLSGDDASKFDDLMDTAYSLIDQNMDKHGWANMEMIELLMIDLNSKLRSILEKSKK
jgi:hypothetical protein